MAQFPGGLHKATKEERDASPHHQTIPEVTEMQLSVRTYCDLGTARGNGDRAEQERGFSAFDSLSGQILTK